MGGQEKGQEERQVFSHPNSGLNLLYFHLFHTHTTIHSHTTMHFNDQFNIRHKAGYYIPL